MDRQQAAAHWARTWQDGWNSGDVDSIVELYADAATFSSQPFREPYRGRDGVRSYVAQAFAEEAAVSALFGRPIIEGDRAAVPWWASLVEGGRRITLAGTSLLRFDADGLVVDQWDTWNELDGERQPPPDWSGPGG